MTSAKDEVMQYVQDYKEVNAAIRRALISIIIVGLIVSMQSKRLQILSNGNNANSNIVHL